MKGISLMAMLILVLLAMLFIEMIALEVGISRTEIIQRSLRELAVLTSIKDVEDAKRFQKLTLRLSFYEAYDLLGERGGYYEFSDNVKTKECIPYWKIYDKVTLPTLEKNAVERVLNFFNPFMKEVEFESISLPQYNDIEISTVSEWKIKAKALTQEKLKLEEEKLLIQESGNFSSLVYSGLFRYFEIGKKLKDKIRVAVENAIEDCGFESSGSLTACGYCPSEDSIFEDANDITTSEAKELIKKNIQTRIEQLEDDLKALKIDRNESSITLDCREVRGGCCSWYCCERECQAPCVRDDTEYDTCPPCKEVCVEYCCGAYYCTTNCNFYYYGAADVKITVSDKTKKFLVREEFKPISLVFRVVDGNEDLIEPSYDLPDICGLP
jgi:hypothetical protein